MMWVCTGVTSFLYDRQVADSVMPAIGAGSTAMDSDERVRAKPKAIPITTIASANRANADSVNRSLIGRPFSVVLRGCAMSNRPNRGFLAHALGGNGASLTAADDPNAGAMASQRCANMSR